MHPRIGVVVSGRGGMLRALLPAFLLGLGGPTGSGLQYLSWIDMEDLLGVLHAAMFDDRLTGPVNAVSPHSVTNRCFSETLARVVRRPMPLGVPAPLARLVLGAFVDAAILASQRVMPERLTTAGFSFSYGQLETSLRHQLGR